MATTKKLMGTTAVGGAEALAIEDVFSTYLYEGNASGQGATAQSITNNIDLSGEGGLVWIKNRDSGGTSAWSHYLFDTERGATKYVRTNVTNGETTSNNSLSAFNSDGFTLGEAGGTNNNGDSYASWTFRKAPRFFDVVTYTGSGTALGQVINHNLGVTPGFVVIKRTDSTSNWLTAHRSLNGQGVALNLSDGPDGSYYAVYVNNVSMTDTTVRVSSGADFSGATYVMYLFAHDPLGPSGDGSDGLIACDSFTIDGSGNFSKEIGWEPQWIIYKRADGTSNWEMLDTMRGWTTEFKGQLFRANLSNAEAATAFKMTPTSTGFYGGGGGLGYNATYIYIAIRRGPMRQPESGTEVFVPYQVPSSPSTGAITGFVTDAGFIGDRSGSDKFHWGTRLTGSETLNSTNTNAGSSNANQIWDRMDGWWNTAINNYMTWGFRRAPGFFDVVAYTSNVTDPTTLLVNHNLGTVPEMMIKKARQTNGTSNSWRVYHKGLNNGVDPEGYVIALNSSGASGSSTPDWGNTPPTETQFTAGYVESGIGYITYLFATLPGVSKVGSYTGNGTSQTINCGFTSGARFILIKRTDSTGDWYVWDTARGIVAGDDPHLSLNTTAAEVTNDDSIDPDSSGFIVNQVSATNINVSSASYIFLAIA